MQVEKGKEMLQGVLNNGSLTDSSSDMWEAIFDGVMGNRTKISEEAKLPQTGMPVSVEQELSSIFVEPCELQVIS